MGDLDNKLRPSVVNRWARSSGDIASLPQIEDIDQYGADLRSWYKSILPKVRVGRREWPPLKAVPTDPRDWDDLRKGSRKGVVILLLSLSWWDAQATTKKDRKALSSVLKDVLFVMRQLAANVSEDDTAILRKRVRGPDPMLPPVKRYDILLSMLLNFTTVFVDKGGRGSAWDRRTSVVQTSRKFITDHYITTFQ